MADIIVTVPKDQVEHFLEDKMPAPEAWWYLGRKPAYLQIEDSIGFVFKGAIRYAGTVTSIEPTKEGRWEIHFQDCGGIDPIPHEPFRGFRYFDIEEHIYGRNDD